MTNYEDAEAAHALQSERQSGSPAPIPNSHGKPRPLRSSPLGYNTFTVVYFMPDGEAIIRYEDSAAHISHTTSYIASQAFAIIKIHPSINGGDASIEFLKSRFDVGAVMQNMADSYLKTNDETPKRRDPNGEDCGECDSCKRPYVSDNPETHCVNCTCIMCIPGG